MAKISRIILGNLREVTLGVVGLFSAIFGSIPRIFRDNYCQLLNSRKVLVIFRVNFPRRRQNYQPISIQQGCPPYQKYVKFVTCKQLYTFNVTPLKNCMYLILVVEEIRKPTMKNLGHNNKSVVTEASFY